MGGITIEGSTLQDRMRVVLVNAFEIAELAVKSEASAPPTTNVPSDLVDSVTALSRIAHASRGALLSLVAYKACNPAQDIRCNKTEHPGGFSGRSFDSRVTIPFLIANDLPRNVETHWLSQTLSFGSDCWSREKTLVTTPKEAGPLLIQCVNELEELGKRGEDFVKVANELTALILFEFIQERNRGQILLTRPKFLTIAQLTEILERHIQIPYRRNAPRLPQLAVYAMYECLIRSVGRYADNELAPLAKMKAADRKMKTVGDIVMLKDGVPVEAVETKLREPVNSGHVAEAIAKIRSGTVDRYFVLSTGNVSETDKDEIEKLCDDFRASNGCEIIANGVIETIKYYLRLLPSTLEYVNAYATHVESDGDLGYEHRTAWNQICAEFAGP